MRNNKTGFFMTAAVLLGIATLMLSSIAQIKSGFTEADELQINVSSSKSSYSLGETVFLDFEVKNNSSDDIRVRGLDLDSNYVSLYVAYSNEKYKQYRHSRVKDAAGGLFKAGQVFKSRSGILWNFSPAESSVNWKEKGDTDILTCYAFPKPGVYFIKATLGIPSLENPITVESKPIQIVVDEPVGDDAEVWNKIKNRPDIGYFIQEGEVRSHKPEEREKLKQEIEQLVNKYPNSSVVNQIKPSLEKFRANEEKRKAALENVKHP